MKQKNDVSEQLDKATQSSQRPGNGEKKAYQPPEIVCYGSVAEQTRAGGMSDVDGGPPITLGTGPDG